MKTKTNPDRAARRAVGGAFGRADVVTYKKLAAGTTKGEAVAQILDSRFVPTLPPPPQRRPEWMD